MPDEITQEKDPFRGFWVRSEEGDIIRPSGERGYWSKEPPSDKFRQERRAKMKQKEPENPDHITQETDPFRGHWVRSEEGDIIRPSGERGYWSKEPPSDKFREERRKKLKQANK